MLTGEYLLVKPSFLAGYFACREGVDAGKIDEFFRSQLESKIDDAVNIYKFDGTDAHISINGPLTVEGPDIWDVLFGYGGCSYVAIQDAANRAAADVSPKGGKVYLHMDTPGGTVAGCDATYQVLVQLAQTHHIVAVNHGLIASAGTWLASAAHEIIASTPTAMCGSIGVAINTFDFSGYYERMGVKRLVITNHESSDKIPDLSTEKGKEIVRDELDALYDVFVERVTAGRKKMTKENVDALKGRVLGADASVEAGLMDSVGGRVVSPPAAAGQSKTEVQQMTLMQLLADNPAAKTEFDAAIAAARNEGVTAEKARIAATAPILESDKYPSAIKRVAIDALKGAVSSEALTIAVAVYDATQEQTAQAVAQAASAAADETRQEQEAAKLDPSKPISSQAELDALIAAQKKGA